MKNSLNTDDDLSIVVYHPLYMFYPAQAQALRDLKSQNKYGSNAIDLMFSPVFTTFIESVLSEIFAESLSKQEETCTDEFQRRLINKTNLDLMQGTWETYKKNFEVIYGKRLNEVVSHEVMKTIGYIFMFRNQTIHGKQIQHELVNVGDLDVESAYLTGNYRKLNDYFFEKKLLTKEELASVTFINDKIINHFAGNVKLFAQALADKVMKKEGLKMYDAFQLFVLNKL